MQSQAQSIRTIMGPTDPTLVRSFRGHTNAITSVSLNP